MSEARRPAIEEISDAAIRRRIMHDQKQLFRVAIERFHRAWEENDCMDEFYASMAELTKRFVGGPHSTAEASP
jgi:hypothetical protein